MEEQKTYKRKGTKEKSYAAPEGKLPPQAIEVEETVLGALMIDTRAIDKVVDILSIECFYLEEHGLIYKAILQLNTDRQPIDMITVIEQLRRNGDLDKIQDREHKIAALVGKVASSAHIQWHAQIIVQKYVARRLIEITSQVQTDAYDEQKDVSDVMQEAENELFKLSQSRQKKGVVQIDPVIDQAYERLSAAYKQAGGLSGVTSGFHALDKITAGWQKSDLIIIAARPAMGKTAFVLSMVKNMAVDYDIPVAMFSLEMSNLQLVNRLITNVCSIPGDKIKNGQLDDFEWNRLDANIKKLQGKPIYVDDTANLSIAEFQTKARRLKEEHDIQIIFIDYLQLMNAGMRTQSREQEVSMISRSLKGLAKELNIPIIALSQLNRQVENRGQGVDGKKPQLSDLRESGAIEQDADMVCFIHRPGYYKLEEKYPNQAQIIIAKHRNGATEDVDLLFKNEYARFMNTDDDSDAIYQTLESRANNMSVNNIGAIPPPSIDNFELPKQNSENLPF